MVPVTSSNLLVPVSDSETVRNTVAYAVEEALEAASGSDDPSSLADVDEHVAAIHFVFPVSERVGYAAESAEVDAARSLLDRVEVWAEEDLGDAADAVRVETALVGSDVYLFSPGDYAEVLTEYAATHGLERAVFDPGFNLIGTAPLLPPLEAEVRQAGLEVVKAPVQRERRSSLLVRRGTLAQFLTLFAVSFGFYLVLAWSVATFELATGAISAGIVAVALWGVSLTSPIRTIRTSHRLMRLALYVPYLLWEIVKANLDIAYVVLHPSLPIDPEMVEFDAAVWSPMSVTTLANSITLTPGTLTVDVSRRHFTVHTLTAGARDNLFDGTLERAVRFVFYGRAGARIPSPAERTDLGDEE